MKRRAKKCFVTCLVLCMLLTMLPVFSASAAPPALDVITDVEYKTIRINGNVPELAGQEVSIIVMDPAFEGGFTSVFQHPDLIRALGQAAVDAEGKFTFTAVVNEMKTDAKYHVFVNGGAYTAEVVFNKPYTVLAGERITLPIIVKNADKFSGLTGVVNYDEELWRFEGISGSDGYTLLSQEGRFITIRADGMGVEGDTIAGYVILTAKANLEADALTTVSFDVIKAAGEDLGDASVRIQFLKVNILLSVMPGDVNLDKKVDLTDAILLLQNLSKNIDLSARQLRAADVNRDGVVNTADVIIIMQMCL